MPAYVIADVTVTDPKDMEEYRTHVPGTLEQLALLGSVLWVFFKLGGYCGDIELGPTKG
jgi:hypothetical protein